MKGPGVEVPAAATGATAKTTRSVSKMASPGDGLCRRGPSAPRFVRGAAAADGKEPSWSVSAAARGLLSGAEGPAPAWAQGGREGRGEAGSSPRGSAQGGGRALLVARAGRGRQAGRGPAPSLPPSAQPALLPMPTPPPPASALSGRPVLKPPTGVDLLPQSPPLPRVLFERTELARSLSATLSPGVILPKGNLEGEKGASFLSGFLPPPFSGDLSLVTLVRVTHGIDLG